MTDELKEYKKRIKKAFENWDKWSSYGVAFNLMDRGHVSLLDIQDIAADYGVKPSIIAYRRTQYLQHKQQRAADWRAYGQLVGDYYAG